jgi:hypothetical protein
MTDHTPVPNPQRAWLENRRSQVSDSLDTLVGHFDPSTAALGAGAWKGKAGVAWEQEFSGRVSQVRMAAQNVRDDLDTMIHFMPATVCRCQLSPFSTPGPFGDTFGSYPSIAASCSG